MNDEFSYKVTLKVESPDGKWYEASAVSEFPFTDAELDDLLISVKPILKEQGFMRADTSTGSV